MSPDQLVTALGCSAPVTVTMLSEAHPAIWRTVASVVVSDRVETSGSLRRHIEELGLTCLGVCHVQIKGEVRALVVIAQEVAA
jgi:hypothetical protein